jgi:hypothetical protein
MNNHLLELTSFVLGGVFIPAILKALQSLVATWLLKTERDIIIWSHYRNRAAKQGHRPKHPLHCEDDGCQRIKS